MAKTSKKDNKTIEETLWNTANDLRGTIEPYKFKDIALSLIFLKSVGDRFDEQREKLVTQGLKDYIEQIEFYQKDNVFYLPETARWTYLQKNAHQNDIAIKVDEAFSQIERSNNSLAGALPKNYFASVGLETSKLASLIDTMSDFNTLQDREHDLIGRVYEYFLSKFALTSGKDKGEFYTPKSVVNFIAEMIEPYKGKIYDPCCGSGGMFVQSMKFVAEHAGNLNDVSIYGQESTPDTYKLAKMNLAMRGIINNLGASNNDTFSKDQHPDLKVDYIMANPPFNLKKWRAADELLDDPRWAGYEVPPVSNANYAWILHMVSKLSENGVAGFLLANGALGDSDTLKIRQRLIENNLVEAIIILPREMFYHTDISVTLWVLNKNKKDQNIKINNQDRHYRSREKEILFMDMRTCGEPYEKKFVQLTTDDVSKAVQTFRSWQLSDLYGNYKNIPEYCYSASFDEVKSKGFSLVPSKYIEFIDKDDGIDFDMEMKRIQADFKTILAKEVEIQQELKDAFKGLGYEL